METGYNIKNSRINYSILGLRTNNINPLHLDQKSHSNSFNLKLNISCSVAEKCSLSTFAFMSYFDEYDIIAALI